MKKLQRNFQQYRITLEIPQYIFIFDRKTAGKKKITQTHIHDDKAKKYVLPPQCHVKFCLA